VPAVRIGVLASGSGTLLEAMLERGLPVALVVVDRECRAQEVAAAHDVPATLVARESFGSAFDKPMFDAYDGRILNTHPALLPAFPGWHAVRDALDHGVKVTGCTVHVATVEVDAGPILAQEAVMVLDDDDERSLHERIKEVERRLYPATIEAILQRGSVL